MAGAGGDDSQLGRLKELLAPRPRRAVSAPEKRAAEERCDLCGAAIPPEHRHLVDLATRNLLCACRPCGLLFTHDGAAGGKFRTVPERYVFASGFAFTEAQWESLQIPVAIAFFFYNSSLGRTAGFYPGPAGATESLLPLATWQEIAAANPLVESLDPDVEALLVYKRQEGCECYLVPIDACYELVGRIRLRWKGFQGGEEAWRDIEDFFAAIRLRSGDSPAPPPAATDAGMADAPETNEAAAG